MSAFVANCNGLDYGWNCAFAKGNFWKNGRRRAIDGFGGQGRYVLRMSTESGTFSPKMHLSQKNSNMSDTAQHLQSIIDSVRLRLLALDEEQTSQSPAPGKWSPRQIIGHLIDSASNNHQRFVRAQFTDDLIFPGYDQEAWVEIQGYASADWAHLVHLWYYFNWHIARVIDRLPADKGRQLRPQHNLHQIALHAIPAEEPATLDYFMLDYVRHLEGHLLQIFPDYVRMV